MSVRRRIGLLIVALPLAFYAYACSSDSDDGGGGTDVDGGTVDNDSGTVDNDSGTPGDSGTDANEPPADAGDSGPPACTGNPITADGLTADGGSNLDAGVTTELAITYPLAVGAMFLDGPQWIDDSGGSLVFSEVNSIPAQLLRVGGDGGAAAALRAGPVDQSTLPIGNAFRGPYVLTTVAKNTGAGAATIWQTLPDGGAGPSIGVGASTNPNDLVVGPMNNLYFTDPQYQTNPAVATSLYRVAGDGGVTTVQTDLPRPNGIALSADNKKLYVGLAPGAADPTGRGVLLYNVAADGSVTAPGASFLTSADLVDMPDGLAIDVGGNLWVAEAPATGGPGGRVEVFGPDKKKLGTIPFTTKRPTGIAFGGTDNKTVFITAENGVFVFKSRCAGVR
jgi:gluconolactonase